MDLAYRVLVRHSMETVRRSGEPARGDEVAGAAGRVLDGPAPGAG